MKRFVEGTDRGQSTLFPECLDDWIDENNPVRVIDAFVDTLDLAELEFEGVEPAETGRPAYHPSALLKLYVYGYLNRVQSSRRLERGAKRNGRDRADEARPAPAADRRARPHGLAAGIWLQLACLGGGRYRPLQARDR
jgi:transposase